MKAVPQPPRPTPPNANVFQAPPPNFLGGPEEWLILNSDLTKLTDCRTVDELERGFYTRLFRTRDFIFYLGQTSMDWRILNVYLYYSAADGSFLPDRTIDQNGRIKRQGGGLWAGLRNSKKKDQNAVEDTNLVDRFFTRKPHETADETIATYLGMTPEEKARELRRILVSMDLILEVAEKKRCWRAAAMYLKMVDYDGSFLPMTSAARDRWEKTYARHVDKWEQLEKRRAAKAAKASKPLPPKPANNGSVPKSSDEKPVLPASKPTGGNTAPKPSSEASGQNGQSAGLRPGGTASTCGDGQGAKPVRGLYVPVVSMEELRAAMKNPIQEVPTLVIPPDPDAVAKARRQALQDRLNAAIPGRAYRGRKGKRKPPAIQPQASAKNGKPKRPVADAQATELDQFDCQSYQSEKINKLGKDPP